MTADLSCLCSLLHYSSSLRAVRLKIRAFVCAVTDADGASSIDLYSIVQDCCFEVG